MFYSENKTLNTQEDLCSQLGNMYDDLDKSSSSESTELLDSSSDCLYQLQHCRLKWGLMMVVTFIFLILTVLSWKVDQLKKKK